jgi:hypothetical protein
MRCANLTTASKIPTTLPSKNFSLSNQDSILQALLERDIPLDSNPSTFYDGIFFAPNTCDLEELWMNHRNLPSTRQLETGKVPKSPL